MATKQDKSEIAIKANQDINVGKGCLMEALDVIEDVLPVSLCDQLSKLIFKLESIQGQINQYKD